MVMNQVGTVKVDNIHTVEVDNNAAEVEGINVETMGDTDAPACVATMEALQFWAPPCLSCSFFYRRS